MPLRLARSFQTIAFCLLGLGAAAGQPGGGGRITYNGRVFPTTQQACMALLKDVAPEETLKAADAPDANGDVHCAGRMKNGDTGFDQYMNAVHFEKDEPATPAGPVADDPPAQPVASTLPNCTSADSPRVGTKPAKNDGTLPVVEYDYGKFPEIGCGILMAQRAKWPSILTYDTFGDTSSEKRRCKRQKRNENIRGSDVVTSRAVSADEYPFASTIENQGSTWISSVSGDEQNAQGGLMSAFYGRYREAIDSGKPFYFEVKVTNIPADAKCGKAASAPAAKPAAKMTSYRLQTASVDR